uniref:Secreted protein n=1 Tax=Caenorhabditis tropicalis TaxID=1561998 RepID=A0A1I7THC4_9PELO
MDFSLVLLSLCYNPSAIASTVSHSHHDWKHPDDDDDDKDDDKKDDDDMDKESGGGGAVYPWMTRVHSTTGKNRDYGSY